MSGTGAGMQDGGNGIGVGGGDERRMRAGWIGRV